MVAPSQSNSSCPWPDSSGPKVGGNLAQSLVCESALEDPSQVASNSNPSEPIKLRGILKSSKVSSVERKQHNKTTRTVRFANSPLIHEFEKYDYRRTAPLSIMDIPNGFRNSSMATNWAYAKSYSSSRVDSSVHQSWTHQSYDFTEDDSDDMFEELLLYDDPPYPQYEEDQYDCDIMSDSNENMSYNTLSDNMGDSMFDSVCNNMGDNVFFSVCNNNASDNYYSQFLPTQSPTHTHTLNHHTHTHTLTDDDAYCNPHSLIELYKECLCQEGCLTHETDGRRQHKRKLLQAFSPVNNNGGNLHWHRPPPPHSPPPVQRGEGTLFSHCASLSPPLTNSCSSWCVSTTGEAALQSLVEYSGDDDGHCHCDGMNVDGDVVSPSFYPAGRLHAASHGVRAALQG
eukprot:GHVR01049240.1.p1 GENE.GHVR01049240.1~~GHVR01049240.1.p1  ORF type:complete len:399 (-),score=116.55 GHVR01049240.1:168-1364(-)